MSKEALTRRVAELEQQGRAPARVCWLSDEPAHLRAGEDVIVVSWEGEETE